MINKEKCQCCEKAFSKQYVNSNQIFCSNYCRDRFRKLTKNKEVFRLSDEDKLLREKFLARMVKKDGHI